MTSSSSRAALLAQVVQVDAVEHDPGLRRVFAQQRQELARHVVPADDDRIEARAMFAQPGRRAPGERRVPRLHAELLQRRRVGAAVFAVGRHEHHVRALFDQQAHEVDQPQRTRIVVRRRRQRIDDQHLALAAVQRGGRGRRARRQLPRERFVAMFEEHLAVAYLVGLGAAAQVGARRRALVVHHARGRLVQHAAAGGAHGERQVGVLVVGGRVARVEAADLLEQGARDRDRGAAQVIGIAQVVEARIGGRFEAPVVPAAAVAEHQAAGFLQAAVRIQQLRADEARVRMRIEGAQHGVEPARLRHRVVVEEHQHLAQRQRGAVVARGDEAAVGAALVEMQARDLAQRQRGLVARTVIDDDDLDRGARRMRRQRTQAGQRVRELVVDRDHDAGARRAAGRHGEWRERRIARRVQRGAARGRHPAELAQHALKAGAQSARAQAGEAAPHQAEAALVEEARVGQRKRRRFAGWHAYRTPDDWPGLRQGPVMDGWARLRIPFIVASHERLLARIPACSGSRANACRASITTKTTSTTTTTTKAKRPTGAGACSPGGWPRSASAWAS
jgi:hypothetical protein